MSNDVIVVKQLPEIEERLQTIKLDVTERVTEAMNLVCTVETLQAVKKIRAELNKEFEEWEEKRKEVKAAVMLPYEQFEAVYKDCITNVFKKGNADLKSKIDSVETGIKENTKKEIVDYFNEYLGSKNIDFVTFENANINITLSASKKSLKEQAKAFIDRICDDLSLIDTQEYKDEILYHYKKVGSPCFLNASRTIQLVNEDRKAIEEAKKKEEERKAKEQAETKAAEKVEEVVKTLTPPTMVDAPIMDEPILTVSFQVRGTKAELKKLKDFLTENKYDFK